MVNDSCKLLCPQFASHTPGAFTAVQIHNDWGPQIYTSLCLQYSSRSIYRQSFKTYIDICEILFLMYVAAAEPVEACLYVFIVLQDILVIMLPVMKKTSHIRVFLWDLLSCHSHPSKIVPWLMWSFCFWWLEFSWILGNVYKMGNKNLQIARDMLIIRTCLNSSL